jgi:hypothetical protein
VEVGLFNGCRGKVHSLTQDSPPVVDVNGKLITLSLYKFDVYDQQQRKVLASKEKKKKEP